MADLTLVGHDFETHEKWAIACPDYLLTECRDGSPLLVLWNPMDDEASDRFVHIEKPHYPDEPAPTYVAPTNCQRCGDPLVGKWCDGHVLLGNRHVLSEDIAGLCERCSREFVMAYRGFMRGRKASSDSNARSLPSE